MTPRVSGSLRRLIDATDWLDDAAIAAAEILDGGEILVERPIGCSAIGPGRHVPHPSIFGRNVIYHPGMWSPNLIVGRYAKVEALASIGPTAHAMTALTTGFLSLDLRQELFGASAEDAISDLPITIIGCDAWIGQGAFVRGGVRVGHGAIVRTDSVVTRDVPDYAIVAGNPARIVGRRFPAELVERLLSIRWWTLPPASLAGLPLADPEACLDRLASLARQP